MKRKSLLALPFVAMISCNIFAMEIHKGRLISHKESVPKDIKINFDSENSLDYFAASKHFIKLPDDDQRTVGVNVNARLSKTSTVTGVMSNIKGVHGAYIQNLSKENQVYIYMFDMCVMLDDKNLQCATSFDTFEIEPQGYVAFFKKPTLQMMFKNSGSYSTLLSSEVLKLTKDGDNDSINSNTEASSTVEVADSKL